MTYNTQAAERIDDAMRELDRDSVEQSGNKKTIERFSYLYNGDIAIGLVKDWLAVRVFAEKMNPFRKHAHVSPVNFASMKKFVFQARTTTLLFEPGLEHIKTADTRPSNS